MILLGGHVNSEMFGKYSAVLLGKISAIKYCHDVRRQKKDYLYFNGLFHVCMLYQIIVYGPKGQSLKITLHKVGKPWLGGEVIGMCNSIWTCSP